MDLSVKVENSVLNIRVAILIKSANGYIFEKRKSDYVFTLGGRIKINESSEDAVKREVKEEINHNLKNLKLLKVIENFFETAEGKFHEILFLYESDDLVIEKLGEEFAEVSPYNIASTNIVPVAAKEILLSLLK